MPQPTHATKRSRTRFDYSGGEPHTSSAINQREHRILQERRNEKRRDQRKEVGKLVLERIKRKFRSTNWWLGD
ncbi:hypothetical protein MUK42_36896 [Musa troglodytarum]|uniref:Uncharacterized protein n=1 Tax=Musa troglodytarum TaxID=320322 RepID=A0A9E7FI23_9LILI|nr:hypothetical protein MUK42_36896 [Musa troglodytarum]